MKFTTKQIAIITFAGFMVCMLPIFLLAQYCAPCADDFGYGLYAHMSWQENHSVWEAIKAAAFTTRENYYAWQGTYTSIFLMSLVPSVFSSDLYAITPYLMIFMLGGSVVYTAKVLIADVCKGKKSEGYIVGLITALLMIETIYAKPSALFWYNASVHYTFMTGCMIFMIGTAVKFLVSEKIAPAVWYMVCTCFFGFLTAGANYSNALEGILFLLVIMAIGLLMKRKKTLLLLIPTVIYVFSFYKSIIAPGNSVRQRSFVGNSVPDTILNSFKAAFMHLTEWFDIFHFFVLILLVPVLWNVAKKMKFRFRFPLLVMVFSFCMMAASFAPSFYSMGNEGVSRTVNVAKYLMQIGLVVNTAYLCGWINKKLEKHEKQLTIPHYWIFYALMCLALLLTVKFTPEKVGGYTSYGAYYYLATGEAKYFHSQFEMREAYLKTDETNVVLEPYTVQPYYLYISDITTDAANWQNNQVARWYGKSSVVLHVKE